MKGRTPAGKTATAGMLFALALVLGYAESLIPPVSGAVPGLKMGLSNIVTMVCVFFFGPAAALMIAVLKSCFVFLTRNAVAFLLSLAGGVCSVAVMLAVKRIRSASVFAVSMSGALTHNCAQIACAMIITSTPALVYYLPVLMVGGVCAGALTAVLLRALLPYLKKATGGDELK